MGLPLQVRCPGACADKAFCCQACALQHWRLHHCLLCSGPERPEGAPRR